MWYPTLVMFKKSTVYLVAAVSSHCPGLPSQPEFSYTAMADQFPRRPDQEEKKDIVDIMFPDGTNPGDIDFTNVWLLSPMEDPTPPDFNCFGWGLLVNDEILPNSLAQCNYTAANAVERYNALYNYTPTRTGDREAVLRFWGYKKRDDKPHDTVNHVSRFVYIALLQRWGDIKLWTET